MLIGGANIFYNNQGGVAKIECNYGPDATVNDLNKAPTITIPQALIDTGLYRNNCWQLIENNIVLDWVNN